MEDNGSIPADENLTSLPVDEPIAILSTFEEARKRIHSALMDVKQNDRPLERFPCTIFHGCQLKSLSEADFKTVQTLFLHLCSMQDQRRWSSKSGYTSRGIRAQRGVCSRSGTQVHNLMHRNVRTSPKCKCLASFTLHDDGNVVFKNEHNELCLPDPNMGNDGYVFNAGLSPTKKQSIIANVSDMLSDYGTTPAAARKQIENSLVKSGDTGFGVGEFFYDQSPFVCFNILLNSSIIGTLQVNCVRLRHPFQKVLSRARRSLRGLFVDLTLTL